MRSATTIAALFFLAAQAVSSAAWTVADPGQGPVPLPAGATGATELSGLAWVAGNQYVAVSDDDGRLFFLTIEVDPATGRIGRSNVDRVVSLAGSVDLEAVVYRKPAGTILVSDERAPAVREYKLEDGTLLRSAELPTVFAGIRRNLSLESLVWDEQRMCLWTANEEALRHDGPVATHTRGSVVRLLQLDPDLRPRGQWAYVTDPIPGSPGLFGRAFQGSGVSELIALPDGTLLVLERAFGGGTLLRSRIYRVDFAEATEVSGARRLEGTAFRPVAKARLWEGEIPSHNFEGAALGVSLHDGSRSLILVSDDGYGMAQSLYGLVARSGPVVGRSGRDSP